MALSVVQQVGAASGASAVTSLSVPISTVTSGSLLVCITGQASTGAAVAVPHDSAGQTWIQAWSAAVYSGYVYGGVYYFPNSAAITTLSVTAPSGGIAAVFYEISGAATTSPVDVNVSAGPTGTPAPSVTGGTTAQANEIAIGGIVVALASTNVISISGVTAGWSTPVQEVPSYGPFSFEYVAVFGAYQILSSATAPTFAGTLSNGETWVDNLVTFKAGATAATVIPPSNVIQQVALQRPTIW